MARKRASYWTQEKLAQLVRDYPNFSAASLVKKYDKSFADIQAAYEFQVKADRMTIEKRCENGIPVTVYAPAYAEGIGPATSAWE